MQRHAQELYLHGPTIENEGVYDFAVRRQTVPIVAARFTAQPSDIEADVPVEDAGELTRKLCPVLQPLALREGTDVEVLPGALIVLRVAGFEKIEYGVLRGIAIEGIAWRRGLRQGRNRGNQQDQNCWRAGDRKGSGHR